MNSSTGSLRSGAKQPNRQSPICESCFRACRREAPLARGTNIRLYLHLLVCYLEQQTDLRVLGELKTKQVMDFWATDHYTWIYQTVISRSPDIGQILRNRKLIPAG